MPNFKTVKKNTSLALVMLFGLAQIAFLSSPVQAQASIDLELGGEGATGWTIIDIKPGDNGRRITTLSNSGDMDGTITIWISDIVNTEGVNTEAETGDLSEPGELGTYLVFSLSSSRLVTNISLPTEINNLPQTALSSNYLKIERLEAGETISIEWQWELPASTINDIQGDSLSFTIYYLLEELSSQYEEPNYDTSPPYHTPSTPTSTPTPTRTPTPTSTPTITPTPTPTPKPSYTPVIEPPPTTDLLPATPTESSTVPDIPTSKSAWPLIGGIIGGSITIISITYFLKRKLTR